MWECRRRKSAFGFPPAVQITTLFVSFVSELLISTLFTPLVLCLPCLLFFSAFFLSSFPISPFLIDVSASSCVFSMIFLAWTWISSRCPHFSAAILTSSLGSRARSRQGTNRSPSTSDGTSPNTITRLSKQHDNATEWKSCMGERERRTKTNFSAIISNFVTKCPSGSITIMHLIECFLLRAWCLARCFSYHYHHFILFPPCVSFPFFLYLLCFLGHECNRIVCEIHSCNTAASWRATQSQTSWIHFPTNSERSGWESADLTGTEIELWTFVIGA